MSATESGDFAPPHNSATIDRLQFAASGLLAAMARGSLMNGAMPPMEVLKWYGHYCVEALVGTEDLVGQINSKTSDDDREQLGKQLESAVVSVSEIFRVCGQHRLFVLHDELQNILRARVLRLPPDFDYTYQGMLPR